MGIQGILAWIIDLYDMDVEAFFGFDGSVNYSVDKNGQFVCYVMDYLGM